MRVRARLTACLVLGLASLLASPSVCWGGDRAHDDGFFLRLSFGEGPGSTKLTSGGGSIEMSGIVFDGNVAIGAIVTPNLAVHATMFGWLVEDPDVDSTLGSGKAEGTLDLSVIGGGVTYYFMPSNIYVSGSAGYGTLSLEGGGSYGESDPGPVVDVTVGKEWWVGDSWGLGVSVGFGYHSVPEGGTDDNWTGTSVAARFSATFN